MTTGAAVGTLAEAFDRFGQRECAGISPLYEALSRRIAASPDLLALAAQAQSGQPAPNMLFGCVHFLLLSSPKKPGLAGHYASLCSEPAPPEAAFPAFARFCRDHADGIVALLRQRIVSTNEVQRCACLLPAFQAIADRSTTPLQLIEVGSSAGLNLLWDQFAYDYGAAGRVGPPNAPLLLQCRPRGATSIPLPSKMPAVGQRIGIDPMPLDPADPSDALWLRALVWPEQRARAARLKAALTLAKEQQPQVRRGDGVALLESLAATLPSNGTLCVYHSFTRNQMSQAARQAFAEALSRIGEHRPLFQIALEWGTSAAPALVLTRHHKGAADETLLAYCDAHGAWLEWQA